ncbi:MAG: hypothetical protein HRT57_07220 [Crocinitomicaceae bacterium]|nr:hypothetical protein [Crocinitomicaceae bacterium]
MMRRINLLFTITLVVTAVIFTSCKQDPAPQFHYEYFGLKEGRYVIYDVVEVEHDDAIQVHETTTYQLKTVWGGEYIDNEGRSACEFRRYKRDTPADPWVYSDLWTGVYDGIRAELIEENQRIVKLVFAPTLLKQWDANAYNMIGERDCYYRDIHEDTIMNNVKFDSTLVVEIDEFVSLIDTVRNYEIYAKDVGLIYKHYVDNHYQFTTTNVILGTEIYYMYVEHGME